jgi:hypothetical protein
MIRVLVIIRELPSPARSLLSPLGSSKRLQLKRMLKLRHMPIFDAEISTILYKFSRSWGHHVADE